MATGFGATLDSLFNRNPLAGMSANKILNFSTLDPRVQKHLQKVYTTLCATLLFTALGVSASLYMGITNPWVGQLAAIGCIMGLGWTPATPQNLNKRYSLLAGLGFAQGLAISPLIALAMAFNPSVILTGLLATTTVFACFSLASLMTPRRSYLFIGGYLASAITVFMVMRVASFFAPRMAHFAYGLELYGGLLVFAAYVLFDTQLIVEQAYAGNMDHVSHAVQLLMDVIAIFVRIVIILMENQAKREAEERKKRDRKRSD